MSLPVSLPEQVIEAVASHALETGYFDRVNQAEPKSAPGSDTEAAVWVQNLRPASSGLNATSVRFEVYVRIYSNMFQEPQDMIDSNVMRAVWALMTAYHGDFTLGGLVESIDLLGKDGDPLAAEAGYIEIDRRLFRAVTITLPVKINDAFDQVP